MCYSTGASGPTALSVCTRLWLVANCLLFFSLLSALVLYCLMPFIATCVDAIGTVFWDRPCDGVGTLVCFRVVLVVCRMEFEKNIFTARKRSLGQGNIFTPVCHSVHRGACVVAWGEGGMHLCSRGGMHGCSRGECVVALGGHVWLLWGVCVVALGGSCVIA